MLENGRAVHAIFEEAEIALPAKKIASKISRIDFKKMEKRELNALEKDILKICNNIAVKPPTVRKWLEAISVLPEIS